MKKLLFLVCLFVFAMVLPLLAQVEHRGEVRILNRTKVPVRVMVVSQGGSGNSFSWEYAPQEGADRDLRLQIRGKPLLFSPGDVLAAFALDSSASFWGPFIGGQKAGLVWDERRRLWTLSLGERTRLNTLSTPNEPIRAGPLRVGNATDLPLRILLTKADGSIHGAFWDLSPRRASREGLELVLPQGPLLVSEGDALVIFATDGSGRYWGPNILGFTRAPFWDSKRRMWSTLIRP
ncbi:hypothetical protein [Anthocerotibacter panamensis]|uniref:hypothetical protein n=1 Tax=Anthocerotibacter panamensis TaxID=2857077 RepID=UPI001C40801C|nr:hypothetical protein [Anthocerotibacter panamensis]